MPKFATAASLGHLSNLRSLNVALNARTTLRSRRPTTPSRLCALQPFGRRRVSHLTSNVGPLGTYGPKRSRRMGENA